MPTYYGVLEGSGTNWGVWFPDVPGCVGAGKSAAKAIESARSALMLFDELDRTGGLVPPPARSADELLSVAEVREAVNNGDRLVPFDMDQLQATVRLRA